MILSKNIFLLLAFCLSSLLLNAQTETIIHHVYLKDGSFLKGKLLSTPDADPLILELNAGARMEIPQQSIKSIEAISTDQKVLADGKTLNPDGLYKIFHTGFLLSRDEFGAFSSVLGLQVASMTVGYQFNKYLSVGGGLGWEVYDMSIFSAHADFRGYYNEKKISPYYSVQAGYGIAADLIDDWNDRIELKGGPLIHPAIGIRFASRKKTNFLLEAGYRFQWAERNDETRERFDKITYRRFSFRLGLKF